MAIANYRLKQTDYNGHFSFSEIQKVQLRKNSAYSFQVFINPATDHFFVKFENELTDQTLLILNISGKVIREISIDEAEFAGASLIKIDRLSLNAGIYFISSSSGNMQKLMLQ